MRRAGPAVVAALVCGCLVAGGVPRGSIPGDEPAFPDGVPRMESAEAQLAYARGVKRSLAGTDGAERRRRRHLAVEAYRAVYRRHPRERSIGAEAAFRAGELLRAGEQAEEALVEFRHAMSRGQRTPFRARACLEIGHLHRRAGKLRAALDSYLDVAGDARAAPKHRDDAWLWAGCMWREMGRVEDARRAWRSLAARGTSPLDRILAYDHLVQTWIDAEDLEAAAGVLDECVRAHSALALEETRTGDRVRNALARMRCVTSLRRAIAERMARKQARDITPPPLRMVHRSPLPSMGRQGV